MLETKIYMVPFGIREAQRELYSIKIWNKGDGSNEVGNYGYEITDDKTLNITGDFDNFDRSKGALVLLKEILNAVF
jgi:hypothetical protein